MTHSRYLRDMARLLRVEQQLTVDELAKRLAVPRSTVYYWVRDLPLRAERGDREPPRASSRDRGQARPADECAYEQALRSYDDLIVQPTFRDFVCIYIVEGYKRDRRRVALANADPAVMRLANRWIWRLTDKSPSLSLRCQSDQSVSELRRYWSETVGEDAATIHARRAREGKEELLLHQWSPLPVHGVLTVTVDDMLLRARLQAWMRRMREGWR
jgi:hypothetical protein